MNDGPKTLREMGVHVDGCGWPEGDAVITEVLKRVYQDAFIQVLNELEQRVQEMGLPVRFRRDRYFNQVFVGSGEPEVGRLDLIYGESKKLSEVGHKRAELLIRIEALRREAACLFSKLANLALEIDITNLEEDGTPVPDPLPDLRKAENIYQPSVTPSAQTETPDRV